MRFDADALGLTPAGTLLLRDLIHEKLGIYFENDRSNQLLDKLAPLVTDRGFDSFLDYYYLLRYDEQAAHEWRRVVNALAVQETYFWREADQIDAVAGTVVPRLLAGANGRGRLTIACVPCATGEEPLSLAMALNEAGWFSRAEIEIRASDASDQAIAKARSGLFRERSFRALPPALREKYFATEGACWRIDPALHARVSWGIANVVERNELEVAAAAPIVFCRNLFIYFADETIRRLAAWLAEIMPTPGYLCLGASESLLRFSDRFELEEIGGAYVYTKR